MHAGKFALDENDAGAIARFRAKLIEAGKTDKTINNILAVLSKALRYAEQVRVISSAPSVGMLKVERPEIVAWSLEEYARLLAAAKTLDPKWYAAGCLAGAAGLRIGEIRALDWRRGCRSGRRDDHGEQADATWSDHPAEGAHAAHAAPRRDVRREPVEADGLDGAQAHR